jgi:hypothetical protein
MNLPTHQVHHLLFQSGRVPVFVRPYPARQGVTNNGVSLSRFLLSAFRAFLSDRQCFRITTSLRFVIDPVDADRDSMRVKRTTASAWRCWRLLKLDNDSGRATPAPDMMCSSPVLMPTLSLDGKRYAEQKSVVCVVAEKVSKPDGRVSGFM